MSVTLAMLERRTARIGHLEAERLELLAECHRAGVSSRRLAEALGMTHPSVLARLKRQHEPGE